MGGNKLTDEELREAAAEAGISPQELRMALAERSGDLAVLPSGAGTLMGPPQRGVSATHAESSVSLAPPEALRHVQASIERQTGKRGHKQGADETDIVDDDAGLTYRIRAQDDGAGGALVRVDVDPSQGKGSQAMAAVGSGGVATVLFALGWLFSFTTLWVAGLGIGGIAGLLLARSVLRLRGSTSSAHAIAAHALMETEDRTPGPVALPPS